MTRQYENLFPNNVARRLGHRWANCRHFDCCSESRDLLNQWVLDRYERDIAGKYNVVVTTHDPYPNGWPELYCRVGRTGTIETPAWGRRDIRNHFFDSPKIGAAYQIWHDVTHHVDQPLDFSAQGEIQAAHQMKRDFIEYAKEQGASFEHIKEAVNALFSHTYLRVLGILWHLETHGNLDKYVHRILNVCAK